MKSARMRSIDCSLRERLLGELNSVDIDAQPLGKRRWIQRGRKLAVQLERDGWPHGTRGTMFRLFLEACRYVAVAETANGPWFAYLLGPTLAEPKGIKVRRLTLPHQGPLVPSLCSWGVEHAEPLLGWSSFVAAVGVGSEDHVGYDCTDLSGNRHDSIESVKALGGPDAALESYFEKSWPIVRHSIEMELSRPSDDENDDEGEEERSHPVRSPTWEAYRGHMFLAQMFLRATVFPREFADLVLRIDVGLP